MKKSILFLLHLPPPVHGSSVVGKYIHDSELVNSFFETSYLNLGTSKSIDEIGRGPLKKIAIYFQIIFSVIAKVAKNNYDTIYIAPTAKGIGFYKDLPVVLLAKLTRSNVILHFHNKGVSKNQHKLIDNLLYRVFFKNTRVMLLSPLLYGDFKKYVKPTDVFYCPNGIPSIVAIDSNLHSRGTHTRLLFLSNLIESKGVFILIEALKILRNKNLDFTCDFVGGEGDITSIQFNDLIKRSNLQDFVAFAGKRFGAEKESYFFNADVFILPSFNDCFPVVLLEAMQYGLPVVSTFEGGIPDIVEDGVTGFLVKQRNAQELADKLELLIQSPELRISMGEKAKERFTKEYTLEIFEKRMVEILKGNKRTNG